MESSTVIRHQISKWKVKKWFWPKKTKLTKPRMLWNLPNRHLMNKSPQNSNQKCQGYVRNITTNWFRRYTCLHTPLTQMLPEIIYRRVRFTRFPASHRIMKYCRLGWRGPPHVRCVVEIPSPLYLTTDQFCHLPSRLSTNFLNQHQWIKYLCSDTI